MQFIMLSISENNKPHNYVGKIIIIVIIIIIIIIIMLISAEK